MELYSYADAKIVKWLEKHGYHPRSDKHGKALCNYFLEDLIRSSKPLQDKAKKGEMVYDEDFKVGGGSELEWTVDLIIGPPITKPIAIPKDVLMLKGEPEEIWLAVDAKTVMTEHGKARRNRQRDLNSFASIMKHHYSKSVVGGIVIVNLANRFKSPLRDDLTHHRNVSKLVEETVQLFREIPRSPREGDGGIEAVGVIVLKHSNIQGDKTSLVTNLPAPQGSDPVNYKMFLKLMKMALEYRYC